MTDPTSLPPIPDATARTHLHGFHRPVSVALLRAAFRRRNPNKFDRAGLRFSTFGVLIDWNSLLDERSELSSLDKAVVRLAQRLADIERRHSASPTDRYARLIDPKNGEPRP